MFLGILVLVRRVKFFFFMFLILSDFFVWRLEILIFLMILKYEFELVFLGDVGIFGLNIGKWLFEVSGTG